MSNTPEPSSYILVTGGAGFIGSHTICELLQNGYRTVVVDNLYNASTKVFDRIKQIVGEELFENLVFIEADCCDQDAMDAVFEAYPIDSVIHLAGYKAVGESVEKPVEYYTNNLMSTLCIIKSMQKYGCKKILFSSSATVYGDPDTVPLTEASPKKSACNPYGWTKWMIEQILCDVAVADPDFDVVLLRYFNPIGAHPSGLIGEDPCGIPNNLVPYVSQTAIGKREYVHVFGSDYDTKDGTGVRDYIHVVDLALGHVAALKWMQGKKGVEVFNLGTGCGSSVLDVINTFSQVCGHEIAYKLEPCRPGDVATNYADCTKANEVLGWKATRNLEDMCRDSWNWQAKNPNGYSD